MMKIAIIGPGAMGMLYGGYLSKRNDVTMVGRDPLKMDEISRQGIFIEENNGDINNYKVKATINAEAVGVADLVVVFVKAYTTSQALDAAKSIIGPKTIVMTLQNGLGNEKSLTEYAARENIIVGNTNQGSSRKSNTTVRHSGLGDTFLGVVDGDVERFEYIREEFAECGFPCVSSNDVKKLIWNKLMINASSSVLSGVLQMPQGYVVRDKFAWGIARRLITEMCQVAAADGYFFDADEQIDRIQKHLEAAPDGLTSIYNDIKNGNMTEVSVINGAVAALAKKYNISAVTHELIVELVHSLEARKVITLF